MTAVYLCRSAVSSIRHQSRVRSVGSVVERRKTSCCALATTYDPTGQFRRSQREVCEYQRSDSRRVAMERAAEHVASKTKQHTKNTHTHTHTHTHTTRSCCSPSIATSSISSLCACKVNVLLRMAASIAFRLG